MKDDAETKKIGIYCDGGTKDIRRSCEIIINCGKKWKKRYARNATLVIESFFQDI